MTSIQQKQGQGQGSAQQVGGPGLAGDSAAILAEIRESLNTVKRDMTNGYARMAQQGGAAAAKCPEVACSSTGMLALLLGGQLILIIAYMMYRDSKESQAKKFY